MHRPTCIFWVNLTPFSLQERCEGDECESELLLTCSPHGCTCGAAVAGVTAALKSPSSPRGLDSDDTPARKTDDSSGELRLVHEGAGLDKHSFRSVQVDDHGSGSLGASGRAGYKSDDTTVNRSWLSPGLSPGQAAAAYRHYYHYKSCMDVHGSRTLCMDHLRRASRAAEAAAAWARGGLDSDARDLARYLDELLRKDGLRLKADDAAAATDGADDLPPGFRKALETDNELTTSDGLRLVHELEDVAHLSPLDPPIHSPLNLRAAALELRRL